MMRPIFQRGSLINDLQAAAIEYVGTTTWLLLFLGAIQAVTVEDMGKANGPLIEYHMYISTAGGLSLLIASWLFFRTTGAIFNPNVSLALMLCGVIQPVRFVLFCVAQLVGAISAAALVLALTPGSLQSK
jgi:aquaporin rerated protein, other eukaryote